MRCLNIDVNFEEINRDIDVVFQENNKNIDVSFQDYIGGSSAKWGSIKGDIDNQTDLIERLDEKYDSDNFISMTNTEIDELFR